MTPFQEKVYKATRKISPGKIITYKELAEKIGYPRSWRAVGNVLAKNQNPQVPCHRVIKSDGKIGSYNRGIKRKIYLLKKEGVQIKYGKITS